MIFHQRECLSKFLLNLLENWGWTFAVYEMVKLKSNLINRDDAFFLKLVSESRRPAISGFL